VETKEMPDRDYIRHFNSSNFTAAFSFTPDSVQQSLITTIRADTLNDNNPALHQHATWLKKVLVFPAQIKVKHEQEGRKANSQSKIQNGLPKSTS
jgi:hypothetical protein